MTPTTAVAQELNLMLDEGVNLDIAEPAPGSFVLQLRLDDASCADCLVPDETLVAIATDALQRYGVAAVEQVSVQHPA